MMIDRLIKPLTPAQIRNALDVEQYLTAVISVPVDFLVSHDIEGLNDLAEERILGESVHAVLSDLSFNVVGHRVVEPVGHLTGEVLLQISAQVEFTEPDGLKHYRVSFHQADPEDAPRVENHYVCPACGYMWDDTWDSECDDDCPVCTTRNISPQSSSTLDRAVHIERYWADDRNHAIEQWRIAHPDLDASADLCGVVEDWTSELSPGDEVIWNDPDNGFSSGVYKVFGINSETGTVEDDETIVLLNSSSGSEAEVFARELSQSPG